MKLTMTSSPVSNVLPILLNLSRVEAVRPKQQPSQEDEFGVFPPGHHDLQDRLMEEPERWDGLS